MDVLDSYWSDERYQLKISGEGFDHSYWFSRPLVLVGRDWDCDVVLPGKGIEDRSMAIVLAPEETHGVVLQAGSKRTGRRVTLRPHHPLRLANYQLEIVRDPMRDTARRSDQADEESLYVLTWKHQGLRFHVQLAPRRPHLVGRAKQAAIRPHDPSLSSLHACLYRDQNQLWIVDLRSENAIHARQHQIKAGPIACGDAFQAGKTRFDFLKLHTSRQLEAQQASQRRAEEEFRRNHVNWSTHKSQLLKSLGQLAERAESAELQLHDETQLLVARIRELENDLTGLHGQHEDLCRAHEQLSQEGAVRDEFVELGRRELAALTLRHQLQASLVRRSEATIAQLREELANHARNEASLRALVTEQQQELELLRRRLLQATAEAAPFSQSVGASSNDETCISSPHFAKILTEAIAREQTGL